jgi:hypothetical protein
MDQIEVARSVREHLEEKGYTVSLSTVKSRAATELLAIRDKDVFLIETVGETPTADDKNIVLAIGELAKRMKERGFWNHYGIATPRTYFRLLKNFEVGGLQALKLHIFLVDSIYASTHLDPANVVELVTQLKAGKIVNPDLIGIDSGLV